MNFEEANTSIAAAVAAGQALQIGKPQVVQDTAGASRPYTVLEEGTRLESLEAYLAQPLRRRGDVQLIDAFSFATYVNRFKDLNSLIFADKMGATFTAILDYHEAGADGGARWGQHRAILQLRQTESWKRWTAANKRAMNQADFAQFLEDNIPDIAEPAGALIVEIARTLEAKKAVTFESSMRASDGSHKFIYHEDVQGNSRVADLKIPDTFVLGLVPYEGNAPYRVSARLRYRIGEGGKLAIWFDLVRLEDILEQAFADAGAAIAAAVAETTIITGFAPKAGA